MGVPKSENLSTHSVTKFQLLITQKRIDVSLFSLADM